MMMMTNTSEYCKLTQKASGNERKIKKEYLIRTRKLISWELCKKLKFDNMNK